MSGLALPQSRLWLPEWRNLLPVAKHFRNSDNKLIRFTEGEHAGKLMRDELCCCNFCDELGAIGVNSMTSFPTNVTETRIPRLATVTISDGPSPLLGMEFELNVASPSLQGSTDNSSLSGGAVMWFSNNDEFLWPGYARASYLNINDLEDIAPDVLTIYAMDEGPDDAWEYGFHRMHLYLGGRLPQTGGGASLARAYGASIFWNVVDNPFSPFGFQPSGAIFPIEDPAPNDLILAEHLIAEGVMRRLDRAACGLSPGFFVTDMEEYPEFTITYDAEDTHVWGVTGSTIDVSHMEFDVVLSDWHTLPLAGS